MTEWLRQSTSVTVMMGPFLDATTGNTDQTTLTITQPDIRISKNGGAWAQKAAAQTLTHAEAGWYGVVLDATDTNTLGRLKVAIHESPSLNVWEGFMVVTAQVWDSYFGADTLDVSVTQWLGTAVTAGTAGVPNVDTVRVSNTAQTARDLGQGIPNAVPGAAGGLFIAGTNAATTVTTSFTSTFTGNLTGSVASVSGAVGSVTGLTAANLDATISSRLATASYTAPPTAVAITDAVWDEDATAHQTAGTFGKAIGDPLASTNSLIQRTPDAVAGAANGIFIAGTNAATTITTGLTTTFTGNLTGSVGSVTGAVGSVTGAVASVTGTVGSVTGNVGGNVTGSVGSVTGLTASNLDATVSSRLSTAGYTAPPSAATVSTAVWTEPVPGAFGAGTAGLALSAAGSAGDPWTTAVPGAYGAGTAGNILGNRLDAAVTTRLAPTVAARTLDVTATGEAGIDWANIGAPTTSQTLSGTTVGTVTLLNGIATNVITALSSDSGFNTEIANAVWGLDATVQQTVGTFGKAVGDPLASTNSLIQRTPDAVAGAANGIFIAGTNAATTVTTAFTSTFTGNLTGSVGSVTGAVGSVTGAVGSVTGLTASNLDATVSSRLSTAGYTAPPSAATISTTVWTEPVPGAFGAGTAGLALSSAGAAGDPWSTIIPGAYGAGTAGSRLGKLPDITSGAAGGVFIAGTNAATTVTTSFTSTFTGNLTGSAASVTGAVGSVTGNVGGNVTGSVGSVTGLTASNLDATISSRLATAGYTVPPTAAANADAVWDEDMSGHVTVGTSGQRFQILRAGTAQAGQSTQITLDTGASAVDNYYNGHLVLLTGGTGAGQAKRILGYTGSTKVCGTSTWYVVPDNTSQFVILPFDNLVTTSSVANAVLGFATPGQFSAGTPGYLLATNLDATVSSRASQASVTTIDDMLDTEIPAITTAVSTTIPGTITTLQTSVNTVDDFLDTEIADIQARLPAALESGRMASALDTTGIDAILNRPIDGSITARQAFRIVLGALAGKVSGAATTTITIRSVNDDKNRIIATVDGDGNRAAITLDLT